MENSEKEKKVRSMNRYDKCPDYPKVICSKENRIRYYILEFCGKNYFFLTQSLCLLNRLSRYLVTIVM